MNLDIGVIRKDRIPVRALPASVRALERFTSALAGRYAPQAVIVSHADLALAFQSTGDNNYFYSAPRLEVSPNITFEERYLPPVPAANGVAPGSSPSSRYSEAEAGALFARLFSRLTRVAAFHAEGDTVQPRDPVLSRREPVETILRHEAVPRALPRTAVVAPAGASGESVAISPSPARDQGWGTPIALHHAPKPLTLPAPEIRRVADQVMREIDHRIVARRERLGKR